MDEEVNEEEVMSENTTVNTRRYRFCRFDFDRFKICAAMLSHVDDAV